jgi:hypothetical protein
MCPKSTLWLIFKILCYLFCKTLICRKCAGHVFLFFKFSGFCPETHSLFAKSEAKTLIRVLRILTQSAETALSARGGGATANFMSAQFVHSSERENKFRTHFTEERSISGFDTGRFCGVRRGTPVWMAATPAMIPLDLPRVLAQNKAITCTSAGT